MAPKTSADMEPRAPASIVTSHDDAEPWRQSSFDLHQGLEVTEIESTSGPAAPVAGDVEAVYVQRLERLSCRLPDRPAHRSPSATGPWARRFDGLAPEEAAQCEAMWWDQYRMLP
jgi:hypothetical protein